jgi:hypothetical protein
VLDGKTKTYYKVEITPGWKSQRLILNVTELHVELFESPYLTALDFCLWVWMKIEVYKRNVDTRDELLSRILDAAHIET